MKKGDIMIEYFLAKNHLRNHCLNTCLKITQTDNQLNSEEKQCLQNCSLKMRDYMQIAQKVMGYDNKQNQLNFQY